MPRERSPEQGSLWDLVWVIPLVTAAAAAIVGVAWVIVRALPSIQVAGGVAYAVATKGAVQGVPVAAPSPLAVSFAIWGLGAAGTACAGAILVSMLVRASREPVRFMIAVGFLVALSIATVLGTRSLERPSPSSVP